MKILERLTLPLILGLLAACTTAPVPAMSPAGKAAALMAPWESPAAPGVAVAVSLDGETAFHGEAGLADLEHGIPITEDTVFHAASLSKQFTAFLVLSLAAEGKLSLDDDIALYLPELKDTGPPVTIRQLLDHVGGLREQSSLRSMAGWSKKDLVTQAQMLTLLGLQRGRNFAPGERFEYSNSGYGLLALIVERVSGERFADFASARIFSPLGMNDTQFRDRLSDIVPNAATSYEPRGDGFARLVLNFELLGSTGLKTTPRDLLKWATNFETHEIGAPFVFEQMAERNLAANGEPDVHGRGQELRRWNGVGTWSHGGRDAGFRAFLLRIPEQDLAVAVLSNRADFDMAKAAYDLAAIFLEGRPGYVPEEEAVWTPATAEELQALEGDYELFPGLIFSISADGDQLFFAPLNSPQKAPLPQIGDRQFMLNPAANISLAFRTDAAGKATAFDYVSSLNGTLKAPRIDLSPFDPSTANLQDYAGTYESDELAARYDFYVEGGQLVAKHLRLLPVLLTPYQDDTFAGSVPEFGKVVFTRDAGGRITGCVVSGALAEGVQFRKLD
ncbi:MAG: serine hydrolase [Hyphomonas sp.]